MEQQKATRRTRIGRVISDKTEKTIKVEFERITLHPKYKKYQKRQSSCLVHDPEEICKLGDIVRIEETKPVSKSKKWIVREIIQRGDAKAQDTLKEASHDSSGINAEGR